jgi:hypothetical protein
VAFAIHQILVNLGMKGRAHLGYIAAELDGLLAGVDLGHAEAVSLQPALDRRQILIGRAEAPAKLIRRQPFVIIGRARRVHLADQLAQRRLLARAALERQVHALQLHRIRRGAAIVGGVGQWMHIALERYQSAFVHRTGDARCHSGTLRHQSHAEEQPARHQPTKEPTQPIRRHFFSPSEVTVHHNLL